MTRHSAAPRQVAAIRRFNRFYTRQIGALDENHLPPLTSQAWQMKL